MDNSGGFTPTPPPPPPPPEGGGSGGGDGGGGGALPQRGLGEILSTAFNIYKDNAAQLLKIVAIVVVPLTLISAIVDNVIFAAKKQDVIVLGNNLGTVTTRSTGAIYSALVITSIIAVIIAAILQAALVRAGAEASIGEKPDIDASFKYGFHRFGSVIWISILIGLIIYSVMLAGAFLIFGVAGLGVLLVLLGIVWAIYANTMLSMSIPSLVVENKRGTEALSRSWNVVKNHFWHALGVIVVAAIIGGVIGGILRAFGGTNWVLSWIFGAIAQIIVAPFVALVTIVLYLDLRSRSESLTVDTLKGELSSNA